MTEKIIKDGQEYFFDAKEIADILKIEYEADEINGVIHIELEEASGTYPLIVTDSLSSTTKPSTPVLLNGKLLFPFTFLESITEQSIKYEKESSSVYILPQGVMGLFSLSSYTNLSYGYKISVTDQVYFILGNTKEIEDGTINIIDKNKKFTGSIICEKMDGRNLSIMREYLNDSQSTDDEVFKKFVSYKESYFDALKDEYKKDYLFPVKSDTLSESYLKIFKDYYENLFGQKSRVLLYSIMHTGKRSTQEEIYLNISIPVDMQKTVYSINFKLKKGNLNASSLERISSILNSFEIADIPEKLGNLSILSEKDIISSANQGIYPDLNYTEVKYTSITDKEAGYTFTYPSIFIPYRQNNIMESLNYRSFKINLYHSVGISTEPANSAAEIPNKIQALKLFNKDTIRILEEGTDKLEGKNYAYIHYENKGENEIRYVRSYFIFNDSRVYKIELVSTSVRPSKKVLDEFTKILSSFKMITKRETTPESKLQFTKFTNKEAGYSFSYPANFTLVQNSSSNLKYDSYTINSKDFSDAVQIYISESALPDDFAARDLPKFIKGHPKFVEDYTSPYSGKNSTALTGYILQKNQFISIYRLTNTLDENNRNNFCYSVDFLRGNKIVSLFISAREYLTADGKILDKQLRGVLSEISASFQIENTPEYQKRLKIGEKRNKKIVTIENYFKASVASSSKIAHAYLDETGKNLYVTVEANDKSGYYRINPDFMTKGVKVLEKYLIKDMVNKSISQLRERYEGKDIIEITPYELDASLDIEYYNPLYAHSIRRHYKIVPDFTGSTLKWNLVEKHQPNYLKEECQGFLENMLETKVNLTIPQDFLLPEAYNQDSFFIPAFGEYNKSAEYFVLRVNPLNDDIEVSSRASLKDIEDKLKRLLAAENKKLKLANYRVSPNNPFQLEAFTFYEDHFAFEIKSFKVYMDENTQQMELKNE
ncbi:MAG: hypothetical protein N2645_01815 [Clostridia bacterium]|nr:hypothetical protein [Clostridia bacterium]